MAPASSHRDGVGAEPSIETSAAPAHECPQEPEVPVLIGGSSHTVVLEANWYYDARLSESLWMDVVCEDLFKRGIRAYKHARFASQEGLQRLLDELTDEEFFLHIGAHGKPGELEVCRPNHDCPGEEDDQAQVHNTELSEMLAKVNLGTRSIRGVFIGACSYFSGMSEQHAQELFEDHEERGSTSQNGRPKRVKSELQWVAGFAHEVAWGEGAIVAMAFWRQVFLQRWDECGRKGLRRPGPNTQYIEKAVAVLHEHMGGLLEHVGLCVYRNRKGKPVPLLVRGELPRNFAVDGAGRLTSQTPNS